MAGKFLIESAAAGLFGDGEVGSHTGFLCAGQQIFAAASAYDSRLQSVRLCDRETVA